MPKNTVLNDSADLYNHNDGLSEKQKWKNMNRKEKIQYFNDYYRMKFILGIIAVGFFIYLLYSIFAPKPDVVLYTAIINDSISEEQSEQLANQFSEHLSLNTEKEKVYFDTMINLSGDAGQMQMASEQRFFTYLAAETIDVIITDEEQFKTFITSGFFSNLEELLPSNLYEKYASSFLVGKEEDSNSKHAYGIYLTDSKLYKNLGTSIEKPVIGIVSNGKNRQNAIAFIQYLLKENR